MSEILGNNIFKAFYNTMSVDTQTSEESVKAVKDALVLVAKPLNIGCFEMIVNSPPNPININGIQVRDTLYLDKDGYDQSKGVRETFVTNEFGIIQTQLYPVKEHDWTNEEEEEIEFLIRLIHDVMLKANLQMLIAQLSITDTVTGACNHAGVVNQLAEHKQKNNLEKYNSIYLDIKNFFYINKRVGREQSDKVLKTYSFMIREFLLKGEIFGRLGGDSFFLVVEKDRTEEALKFITSRRVLVQFEEKSQEFDLMVKAGVYKILQADTPDKIISLAKTAYEYTKNPSAGDIVWFSDRMLENNNRDEEVTNSFKKAIAKKEFQVFYQPKVDLKTLELTSAEALCRWIKNGSVVPPMDFIPVLENDGTIGKLDFYMLNEVCENIKDWQKRGIEPVRISVNFSRSNVLNKKLADKILKVIKSHNVDTKYIEIEITEVSGYEDFESLSEFVNVMRNNGVETSIDDFGTGYSSLNLIKDLNVDTIKLDKSFLEKISSETGAIQDRSVVKNIINMVNELDMKVVAEGVETDAQMDFLRQVNCQIAQGYLFDKPMPKAKFEFRLLGERMY